MPKLHDLTEYLIRHSPGVLLVRQDLPVGEAIETLVLIWEASEADEWANLICLAPSLVTIPIRHKAVSLTFVDI